MKIGFIGLGNMGSGIAANLIKAGHTLTVYNRTKSRAEDLQSSSAKVADTPGEAADDAEFLITMLADDQAVETTIHSPGGAIASLPTDAIHISLSTISVDLSRFVTDISGSKSIDKEKLLDRFVTSIMGGEISTQTRATLLKQLDDQVVLPSTSPTQVASFKAPVNPFETAFQRGALNPGGGGGQQQQQLASVSAAEINNALVKLAGLILGSPEFQRQ